MHTIRKHLLFVFLLLLTSWTYGQNQNISNGVVFDGEPYLAVNPADARHMVVAWMGYVPFQAISIKTRVTFDGGSTWSVVNPVSHVNSAYGSADPSLAFNSQGEVFLSFVDFNTALDSGAVYVVKSDDGGLNWGEAVEVINAHSDPGKYPVDRPWISIDRSGGVYDGNVYITTMPPNVFGPLPPPYRPYFISSSDGGAHYNPWRYLDTINWLAGNFIPQPTATNCVSGDGTFYAIYPSYVPTQNLYAQFILAASPDAGNHFSYHTVLLSDEGITDTLAKKGYLVRSDPSDTDHLAFFFLNKPYGNIDIYMTESFDGGVHWHEPVRVNDDPPGHNRMQDLLWASFDSDGDLVVTWRDRRNGTDSTYNTASEIWGAIRLRNTASFSSNFRISDTLVAYDTILAYAGNDFMCVQLADDTINAVWGDTRNGKMNIWFQRLSLEGVISGVHLIAGETIPEVMVYPTPFSRQITFEGNRISGVKIYDMDGRIVADHSIHTTIHSLTITTRSLPDGIYVARISTADGLIEKKIIRQRAH